MFTVHRTYFILTLATLVVFAFGNPVSAQGRGRARTFSGGSNNNSNDDNDNSDNNNQGGNRRTRNRDDDDDNNGGLRFGGSDAQKIQDAIQSFQGNPGQSQLRRNQQGLQINKNDQLQNFRRNNQGSGQNQFRRRSSNMQSWAVEFGGSTPFSVKWYEDHPQAFHHHHHHHDDDAWKVATAAGVLGFLGWGAHHHHHPHDTTIVYQSVPFETYVIDPNAPGEWMMLGVYTIMTGPGDDGTRLVELAVDKHGHIRGNYYDTISNASHNVTGHIHEPTQQVQWRLDSNKQLVFFTPLSQLTQSQGVLYVRFPSGKQQQWQLARMDYAGN